MKKNSVLRPDQWWANLPLRWKGVTVLLIPVTALICGFASVYIVGEKESDAELWLYRTGAVRYHLRSLLTAVLEAESAVRGFVITRDPHFVELYRASEQVFPRSARELTNLVAENPDQKARLNEIKELAQVRLHLLSQLIDAVDAGDDNAMKESAAQVMAQGNELMDQIRPKIAAMDEEETVKEETRSHQLQTAHRLSTNMIGLSALIGVLGGAAGMILFSHGIVRQVKKIQVNAERLAKESPLENVSHQHDEVGELGRRIFEASELLRHKQQALRESESRLQAVLDHTPSVMYVKDLNGRFLLVNKAFAALLECSPEEMIGKTGHDLYPTDEAEIYEANDRAALAAGRAVQSEETLQRPDGVHTFITSKFPLLDANGKPYALCGISTDITERAQNAADLAAAKAQAERASEAKSEFLSRMSHELRTPLNAILGFAQLLELKSKQNGDHECVDQILHAGSHLLGLINEVLDISRIEQGALSISTEPVELHEVINECVQLIRPLAERREIELKITDAAPSDQWVLADRQRVKQVLLNFLSNAVNYNRERGKIFVSSQSTNEDKIRIEVRDTGNGIAKEDLGRLFIPFERLHQNGLDGSGLGLALSKRLTELMGGQIGADSELGQGATFWIELRQAVSPLKNLKPGSAKPTSPDAKEAQNAKTVLYIEDNLSNFRLVQCILETQPQIKLLPAIQGSLGLDLARQHRPDLILLDLNLPDMHGSEVLKRLRAEEPTSETPVVVISADATDRQIKNLHAAGADDYLVKPINIEKFVSVLEKVLGPEVAPHL